MQDILQGAESFVATINNGLDELKIDRSYISECDHICYRVETHERYVELVKRLKSDAELLDENEVNGRMIATFRLRKPLAVGGWQISYLELPAPKLGSEYAEGLEHVEFVVLGGNLDRFIERHAHLAESFSYKGMTKTLNPELGLKTASISVKFHRLPLGEVVRIERLLSEAYERP